jgi:transcriptional antiterminator RfaH
VHVARKTNFLECENAFPESENWYLAQLKPNGFDRAVLNLNRQAYRTFMPMRDLSTQQNGRVKTQRKPLFPGYVFTQILPEKSDWRAINNTYGVARLVALSGGRPSLVPRDLMQCLFDRTDGDGTLLAPKELRAGDTVRIVSGPFAEQIAMIEDVKPNDRVVLLMGLMGRSVRTQISPSQLDIVQHGSIS